MEIYRIGRSNMVNIIRKFLLWKTTLWLIAILVAVFVTSVTTMCLRLYYFIDSDPKYFNLNGNIVKTPESCYKVKIDYYDNSDSINAIYVTMRQSSIAISSIKFINEKSNQLFESVISRAIEIDANLRLNLQRFEICGDTIWFNKRPDFRPYSDISEKLDNYKFIEILLYIPIKGLMIEINSDEVRLEDAINVLSDIIYYNNEEIEWNTIPNLQNYSD